MTSIATFAALPAALAAREAAVRRRAALDTARADLNSVLRAQRAVGHAAAGGDAGALRQHRALKAEEARLRAILA